MMSEDNGKTRTVNGDDPCLLLDEASQGKFPFIENDGYNLEYVGETRQGHGLFRRKEVHGGHSYWTDEVGGGMCVYDEGLTNIMSVFEAMEDLKIGKLMWDHVGEAFGYK